MTPLPDAGSSPSPNRPPPSIDLLRALLENTPNGVYFKDRDSRFLMISRSQARQLGLVDPQEAYGKCDHDFFSAEHADQARADELRIMESGEPIIDVVEKETWPDGHVTWAATTKLPLRDAAGRIAGTFGISRDVTAHKVAEERLREAQRDLMQATRRAAVAEFAAGVFTEALGIIENARLKTDRIRRRVQRTPAEAMGRLAGSLTNQLANGTAEHQLAIELCALATTTAAEQRALGEDLDELQRHLKQLSRLLELPH